MFDPFATSYECEWLDIVDLLGYGRIYCVSHAVDGKLVLSSDNKHYAP